MTPDRRIGAAEKRGLTVIANHTARPGIGIGRVIVLDEGVTMRFDSR
jgi:hypothetical protein